MKKTITALVVSSSTVLLLLPVVRAAGSDPTPMPSPNAQATFDPFKESKAEYDARAQWLRDAKLGVFIHWNPSSVIGKEISWSRHRKDYPADKYDQLYRQFKGEKFNADEWVKLFRDAGIRYAVIVPKHHDGFCMFDTRTSDYNVMNSPFGRDYVREMAEACGRGGVKFCLYYSVLDWWNPKYSGNKGADLTAYKNEVFKPHMKELLTKYGPVGYIWFDGNWEPSWTHADGREMYDCVRRLQPSTLIGDRIEGCGYRGPDALADFGIREMQVGPYQSDKAWDSCYNLSPNGWSWTPPMLLRPLENIVDWLIQCIGSDGAMLLGVGPRPDGVIDPPQAEELLKLGAWMKTNGEAVYGTRGGPYKPGPWGASTRRGDKVFLFANRWRNGALRLPALPAEIKAARLLTSGPVNIKKEGAEMVLWVPEEFRTPISTVVELTLDRDAMSLPVMEVPMTRNLAAGKPVEVSSTWPGREKELSPRNITDGREDTMWAADPKAREASVTVDLQKECEVGTALLIDAPYDRTREFDLEAKVGNQWRRIAAGTRIGNRLWLDFDPVKARYFRLNIRKADGTPTLSELQLY